MSTKPKHYPSDVSDEEWAFCAPYLTLMKEHAPQRTRSLRQVYNALRWLVRAGCSWRMMPHEFPAWWVVQQQTQRWLRAGCFEAMAHDLRAILRMVQDRTLCLTPGTAQKLAMELLELGIKGKERQRVKTVTAKKKAD